MNINKRKTINVVVILILTGIMLFLGKERRGESVVETKDLHSAYRDVGKENGESLFQIIGQEMLKKTNDMTKQMEDEVKERVGQKNVIELPEMEWALFLETEVSYGANGDTYYQYGIYGDFTKRQEEGEEVYFSLHKKVPIKNPPPTFYTKQEKQDEEYESHKMWADCMDEIIVDCSPDLKWIVTREWVVGKDVYMERWYKNGEKIKEFKGSVSTDVKLFIPQKKEGYIYSVVEEELVISIGEYMSNFYKMNYREYNRGLNIFSNSGEILAASNKNMLEEPNGIYIYSLENGEMVLLYELSIPISKAGWPIVLSQVEGNQNSGWVVFSYGKDTYRMTYPDGKIEKLGEFMFFATYSPDEKYLAYCTGNRDLHDYWMCLDEIGYQAYYLPMKEEWDKIPQGWYVINLETGEKSYIPVPIWTYDADRPLYGGRCTWIEKDKLKVMLEM